MNKTAAIKNENDIFTSPRNEVTDTGVTIGSVGSTLMVADISVENEVIVEDKTIIVAKEKISNASEYEYALGQKGAYRRDKGDFFDSFTPCPLYPELEDIPVQISYTGPKIDIAKWGVVVQWLCRMKKKMGTEIAANIYWNKEECKFYIKTDKQVVSAGSVNMEVLSDANLVFLGNVHVHPDGFHGFSGTDHDDNTAGFQISINTDGSAFCDFMAYGHRIEGNVNDILEENAEAEVELDLDESMISRYTAPVSRVSSWDSKWGNYAGNGYRGSRGWYGSHYQGSLFDRLEDTAVDEKRNFDDIIDEDVPDFTIQDIIDTAECVDDDDVWDARSGISIYPEQSDVCPLCGKSIHQGDKMLITINGDDDKSVVHADCLELVERFATLVDM